MTTTAAPCRFTIFAWCLREHREAVAVLVGGREVAQDVAMSNPEAIRAHNMCPDREHVTPPMYSMHDLHVLKARP